MNKYPAYKDYAAAFIREQVKGWEATLTQMGVAGWQF